MIADLSLENNHTVGSSEDLQILLQDKRFTAIPKAGDVVKGTVISISKGEVRIDIEGYTVGVVRGRELYHESKEYSELKPGDVIEATVIEVENENGELELSFRTAGQQKMWNYLCDLVREGTSVKVKVRDANKGGLMVTLDSVSGFLPVSQLNPDFYPRVPGGEKQKIFDRLKEYVNQEFTVKVIDVDEAEGKLIVSQKAVWDEEKKGLLKEYKVGDLIEGTVHALTSFGAFIRFNDIEGLVHISEIVWQRIDHPKDILKIGDTVQAQIIGIDGPKIFLSMKRLKDDPWKLVAERYAVGTKVSGRIIKINPFGLFVELDKEIHGLAHISELSNDPIQDIYAFAKEGEEREFEIVSIEPAQHRLGLRIPGVKKKMEKKKEEEVVSSDSSQATDTNTPVTPDAVSTNV